MKIKRSRTVVILSLEEVAKIVQLSPSTIRKLEKEGSRSAGRQWVDPGGRSSGYITGCIVGASDRNETDALVRPCYKGLQERLSLTSSTKNDDTLRHQQNGKGDKRMPRASDDKDRLIARSLAIIIVLLKRLEDGDVSEPNDAENAMLDEWKEMMDTWKASYTTKEAV
jgi:hypothetical protein